MNRHKDDAHAWRFESVVLGCDRVLGTRYDMLQLPRKAGPATGNPAPLPSVKYPWTSQALNWNRAVKSRWTMIGLVTRAPRLSRRPPFGPSGEPTTEPSQ